MNAVVLQTVADEFLAATNPIYSECSSGIALVQRIAVNVSSGLAGDARAYLLPSVYGYWERFFRMTLIEFVSSLGRCRLTALSVSPQIASVGLREQIALALKQQKIKQLTEIPSSVDSPQAHAFFAALESWFGSPFRMIDPDAHVDTSVNVRYEILASNLATWGVDIERVKELVLDGKCVLYPDLKRLVDRRNDIAHGNVFTPCEQDEWTRLTDLVLVLMNALQLALYEFLREPSRVMR